MRGQLSSPLTKRWIWCLSLAGIVLAAFLLNSAAGGEYIASHAYHYGVQDPLMDSILNETLGFQKIFVLNIKSRTDRRDGMALAASMTNLSLHFLEASTGGEHCTKQLHRYKLMSKQWTRKHCLSLLRVDTLMESI